MLQRLYHYVGLLSTIYPKGMKTYIIQCNTNIIQNKKYVSEENTTEY